MRILVSFPYAAIWRMKKTRLSSDKNIIGDRLRQARRASSPRVSQEDLSESWLAQGSRFPQTSISKVGGRTRYVIDYEATAIAKALRASVAWLFRRNK
jgi:hypothetical protein